MLQVGNANLQGLATARLVHILSSCQKIKNFCRGPFPYSCALLAQTCDVAKALRSSQSTTQIL